MQNDWLRSRTKRRIHDGTGRGNSSQFKGRSGRLEEGLSNGDEFRGRFLRPLFVFFLTVEVCHFTDALSNAFNVRTDVWSLELLRLDFIFFLFFLKQRRSVFKWWEILEKQFLVAGHCFKGVLNCVRFFLVVLEFFLVSFSLRYLMLRSAHEIGWCLRLLRILASLTFRAVLWTYKTFECFLTRVRHADRKFRSYFFLLLFQYWKA